MQVVSNKDFIQASIHPKKKVYIFEKELSKFDNQVIFYNKEVDQMIEKEKNVYIGCGPDIKEGFLHADVRKFEHVNIVCNAWNYQSR